MFQLQKCIGAMLKYLVERKLQLAFMSKLG